MGTNRWPHPEIERPGAISPSAAALFARLAPLYRLLHRGSLAGTERLPQGGYLLVANHPSGVASSELGVLASLWASRFGTSRPLAGFALAATFTWWPLSILMRHLGAIPSTYDAAASALARRVPIVVFPGGDHEALRPFWRMHDVDFGERVGFLRIARKAWVPVVPMGITGVAAPMLFGSRWLAYLFLWPWLTGLKRAAVSVMGVMGALVILAAVPLDLPWRALLAYAWIASPIALFGWWPATVRIRVGEPIAPEALFGTRDEEDDSRLAAARERVEHEVQALLEARGLSPREQRPISGA